MLSLLESQMSHVSDFKMPLCISICLIGKTILQAFPNKKLKFLETIWGLAVAIL